MKDGRKKGRKSGQAEEQQKFRNFFVRGFGKVRAVDDGREDSCFGFSIQGTYTLLVLVVPLKKAKKPDQKQTPI